MAKPYSIVTFLPNETLKTFSVWSLQDEITEGIECLYYSLEPVDEFVYVPYNESVMHICIEDDDSESVISGGKCIIIHLHLISYYTVVEIGFNMVMSNFTEDNEVVDVEIYKQGLTTLTTVVNVTSVCNASGMQFLHWS